jgi:hypothetical protein
VAAGELGIAAAAPPLIPHAAGPSIWSRGAGDPYAGVWTRGGGVPTTAAAARSLEAAESPAALPLPLHGGGLLPQRDPPAADHHCRAHRGQPRGHG